MSKLTDAVLISGTLSRSLLYLRRHGRLIPNGIAGDTREMERQLWASGEDGFVLNIENEENPNLFQFV